MTNVSFNTISTAVISLAALAAITILIALNKMTVAEGLPIITLVTGYHVGTGNAATIVRTLTSNKSV